MEVTIYRRGTSGWSTIGGGGGEGKRCKSAVHMIREVAGEIVGGAGLMALSFDATCKCYLFTAVGIYVIPDMQC